VWENEGSNFVFGVSPPIHVDIFGRSIGSAHF
jgi:hypothetical protein